MGPAVASLLAAVLMYALLSHLIEFAAIRRAPTWREYATMLALLMIVSVLIVAPWIGGLVAALFFAMAAVVGSRNLARTGSCGCAGLEVHKRRHLIVRNAVLGASGIVASLQSRDAIGLDLEWGLLLVLVVFTWVAAPALVNNPSSIKP